MKRLVITLLSVLPIWAQTGQPVRVSDDPSASAVQKVYVVSGSSTVAICTALSQDPSRVNNVVAISAVSKANPAVVTSTGHGFDTNSRPQVRISGATGTGWTGINDTWTATVIDANTFSIPIDSTGFGTLGGTVTFTTTAPRKTVSEWSVQKIAYDGSGNAIWSGWLAGATAYRQKCSDATSTTVVQQ